MPTFSSAQVTDPFLSTSELLAPMAAYDTHQNQLYKQQSDQQQIGMTDMSVVARAAAPLLGMSETDAAAAYPGIVADLQRQGFAKQAPSTYPGHAVTQSLVQRGMTVPEQIQGGFVTAPGVTDALKAAVAPLPGLAVAGVEGISQRTASSQHTSRCRRATRGHVLGGQRIHAGTGRRHHGGRAGSGKWLRPWREW